MKAHQLIHHKEVGRQGGVYTALDPASEEFSQFQSAVLEAERSLLYCIGFDMQTYKPHKYFMDLFKMVTAKPGAYIRRVGKRASERATELVRWFAR